MKIIFFGSSEFSIPFLEAIYRSNHEISAVVTNIDRETGRGRKVLPNPVKLKTIELGLKFLEIVKMDDDIFRKLLDLNFDGFVVVSFGHIIPENILNLSNGASVNVHPSLLPKYRGPSPITTALMNGDVETGVSIIRISKELDCGDIFIQTRFKISDDDNRDILEKKIIETGAPLLVGVLNLIETGIIEPYPQTGQASYTRTFDSSNLKINWSLKAKDIVNKIRAFSSEPGVSTTFNNLRIKILNAREYEDIDEDTANLITANDFLSGAIIKADKHSGLIVKCKSGEALKILELKVEGKNRISYLDFLNGYNIKTGDYFI
ncbi:MAG: methionyl-tRNA formyltransferase [Actinobacteria bacterium]|nr:methionyl-tRNA formyltransferase [Actinomycetota bacterium]MCL6087904.1 methionyl-tRNA formyltransferase [Actinomycetota bacterium]